MVTGQVPPEAMERLSYDTLEIPRELPENIRTALQIGLAVRAPERYASVEQFQSALSGESPVTVSNRSFKTKAIIDTNRTETTIRSQRKRAACCRAPLSEQRP